MSDALSRAMDREAMKHVREQRDDAVAERDSLRSALDASRANEARLRAALERLDSAVWDRLYAEGPLSQEYAQAIAKEIKAALASSPGEALAAIRKAYEALQYIDAWETGGEKWKAPMTFSGAMESVNAALATLSAAFPGVGR